jgi:hypothetical protein
MQPTVNNVLHGECELICGNQEQSRIIGKSYQQVLKRQFVIYDELVPFLKMSVILATTKKSTFLKCVINSWRKRQDRWGQRSLRFLAVGARISPCRTSRQEVGWFTPTYSLSLLPGLTEKMGDYGSVAAKVKYFVSKK